MGHDFVRRMEPVLGEAWTTMILTKDGNDMTFAGHDAMVQMAKALAYIKDANTSTEHMCDKWEIKS